MVVEPFVGGALIAMASSRYLGRPTSFGQAYRTAAARAVPLASLAVIFFFIMIAVAAVAILCIAVGCELVVSAGALALPFLRSGIAANAFETVAFGAAALVGNAFCCVFYFDLRVREEGYDLQLAASEVRRLSSERRG